MKMLQRRGTIQCSALLAVSIGAGLLLGCTRDPNVIKARYLKSGEHYAAEGKQQEAIIQFDNAIKTDHNYAAAHYDLAKSYMNLGAYPAAYTEFLHTVALDPHNMQARLDLGNLLLAANQLPKSEEQANAILAMQPNNADAIALLSNIALRQNNRAEALKQIQRALAIDPNRSKFHTALALIESSDPAQEAAAEAELQKAISLDPKDATPHLVLAALLARKGDLKDAQQNAVTAVALDPRNIRGRLALVGIYLRTNNKAAAEATLLQGTELLSDTMQGSELLWDYYLRTGQANRGPSVYANLVAKHPKSVPLKIVYARILIQQQNFAQATKVTDELMKSNSGDPQVAVLNGMLLLHSGQVNAAYTALQKAETNSPDNVPVKILLAQAAEAKGDLSDAEQNFQAAARLEPANALAEAGLAAVANQLGDYNLLMQVATNTLSHYPDSSDAYLWKGIAEIHQNQIDEAGADFQTALEKGPTNTAAMEELGALRLSQNRIPQGKQLLEQALTTNPNDARALRILVAYDLHDKQVPAALARVQQQIAKSPNNGEMYDLLSALQIQTNNIPAAVAAAQKAMAINSSDPNAITNYTRAEVMQGDPQAAIATWNKWVTAHPNDAHAYAILGALEEAQANPNVAEDDYKKALAIQPDQPAAANNLAYLMMSRGQNIDVALSLAEVAHRAMPNSPDTADTLAWAYYNKGTYGSARDMLEGAERTSPDNPSIEYHLGMIYSKLGDKQDAILHLKKAAALAPNTQIGKSANQALHALG